MIDPNRRLIIAVIAAALSCVALFSWLPNPVSAALNLPPGFVSETIIDGLTSPTTIAFAPNGRMFIAQKDGRVRVFQNGALLPDDFIDISAQVNTYWDRGLLGIAIHPDFPDAPYVYLLFTYDPPGVTPDGDGARVSRLIRVSADPSNTNVVLPGSEVVLLGTNSTRANIGNEDDGSIGQPASCAADGVPVEDCIPADGISHGIGTVLFGQDGSLYVGNGDAAQPFGVDARALRVQNLDSLSGKILRIDPLTGVGLPDNPFFDGNPAHNRSKVWSYGLRNPFRFAQHPASGELYIGDVGWNAFDEIDAGRGRNFGWPCYEGGASGSAVQPGFQSHATTQTACAALYAQGLGAVQAPLYAYFNDTGGTALIVGDFYRGTAYPAAYQGALFFGDYDGDYIRYATLDELGNLSVNDFATDVSAEGGPVQLISGPDSNLYYVVFNGTTTSEVRRIRYVSGGNTPPTANASASPTSGPSTLPVSFSSGGSFDPDAQPLTYQWAFGDGSTSTQANPIYTYTIPGLYTAVLTVTDALGASGADSVQISVGNHAPEAIIASPTVTTTYDVGDMISFSGTGTDVEDGTLPGVNMQWEVRLRHNQHVHFDYYAATGASGSFVAPDHGDNTSIEVCLSVTDSGGLSDATCVNLLPNTIAYTFVTEPPGLQIVYEGQAYTAPLVVNTIVSSQQDIIAPQTQSCYAFDSWSDGGAYSHAITIGPAPQTLTATYANFLRSPWLSQDIGNVGVEGGVCYDGSQFAVLGSGLDIWDTSDSFRFVYQPWSGDGEIVARVVSVENTYEWAKAGVMIRESLATNSRHASMFVTPVNGVSYQRRLIAGDISYAANLSGPNAPHWVRIARDGDTFTAYHSADGLTWTWVGSDTITMTNDVYIGLAVTSHNNAVLNSSTLDGVFVNTAPTISDIPEQTTDANVSTPPIAFTVGDAETPAAALVLNGTSSNPALVPDGNILFGGGGANRSVTLVPQGTLAGTATITITVSDGLAQASDVFTLTVEPRWFVWLPLVIR